MPICFVEMLSQHHNWLYGSETALGLTAILSIQWPRLDTAKNPVCPLGRGTQPLYQEGKEGAETLWIARPC